MTRQNLINAVRNAQYEEVKKLLNDDKSDIDEDIVTSEQISNKTWNNETTKKTYRYYERLLDIAVETKQIDMVKLLLIAGAKPTTERIVNDEDVSMQPLAGVMRDKEYTKEEYQIAKLLIMAGADTKDFRQNLMEIIYKEDDIELFNYLNTNNKLSLNSPKEKEQYSKMLDKPNEIFFDAVKQGNANQVKKLIESGSDIEAKNKEGNTPLLLASLHAHQAIVHDLLILGANNKTVNFAKQSFLHCAIIGGLTDIAKTLLLTKKAGINDADQNGKTPLMLSILHNRMELADELIKKDADMLKVDNEKNTLLHLAVLSGSANMVNFILQAPHKIHLDATNAAGDTPLLLAVIKKHDKLVAILIEAGANILIKNKCGKNLLELDIKNESYYPLVAYHAARCFFGGDKACLDNKIAEFYLHEAANSNYADAQFSLAEFYRKVKRDYFLAAKWYLHAAENNNPDAQYEYGRMLLTGSGINENKIEAYEWLEKAKNHGQEKATALLEKGIEAFLNKKRKYLDFTKHVAGLSPKNTSDLSLYNASNNPKKRVRIEDVTLQLRDWFNKNIAKQNMHKYLTPDPKNEIIVSMGFLFSINDHTYFRYLPIHIPIVKNGEKLEFYSFNTISCEDKPITSEKFAEHAARRINRGEEIFKKTAQNKENLHMSFFNRKNTDINPKENKLNYYKHSEQFFYEYLNIPGTAANFVQEFVKATPEFVAGVKAQCLIVDIYSLRCMCPNCKVATVGVQNSVANTLNLDNFLEQVQNELKQRGIKLLTKEVGVEKTHLKMVTRIRYDDDSTLYFNTKGEVIKHINFHERDIKLFNNTQLFEQKHNASAGPLSTLKFTRFMSGSS